MKEPELGDSVSPTWRLDHVRGYKLWRLRMWCPLVLRHLFAFCPEIFGMLRHHLSHFFFMMKIRSCVDGYINTLIMPCGKWRKHTNPEVESGRWGTQTMNAFVMKIHSLAMFPASPSEWSSWDGTVNSGAPGSWQLPHSSLLRSHPLLVRVLTF